MKKTFKRIKKMIYAVYVKSFNSVDGISTGLIMNFFKGINSFDYIEEFSSLSLQDAEKIFKRGFHRR